MPPDPPPSVSPRAVAALARRVAALLRPRDCSTCATVVRRGDRLARAIEAPPRASASAFLWLDEVQHALHIALPIASRAAKSRGLRRGIGAKDRERLKGVGEVLREWLLSYEAVHFEGGEEVWEEEVNVWGEVPEGGPGEVAVRAPVFDGVKIDLLRIAAGESRLSVICLVGAVGSGRSRLAAAIARDATVRLVFEDGVAWVGLGEGQGEGAFQGVLDGVAGKLGGELEEKRCLVVVDDVEGPDDEAKLEAVVAMVRARAPFRRACVLYTTTGTVGLSSNVIMRVVGALEPGGEDACAVLDSYARFSPLNKGYDSAMRGVVLKECAGSTLALALAGAALRKSGYAWETAARVVCGRVSNGMSERAGSVVGRLADWLASLCGTTFGTRLLALSVLPSDAVAPMSVVGLLWAVDATTAESAARRMERYGLVQIRITPDGQKGIVLQRAVHEFCRSQERTPRPRQRKFVDTVAKSENLWKESGDGHRNWWRILGQSRYVDCWMSFHLAAAGLDNELASLLCDLRWLCARARLSQGCALEDDFAVLMSAVAAEGNSRRDLADYSHAVMEAVGLCNRSEAALAWYLSLGLSGEFVTRNTYAQRVQASLDSHAVRPCFREINADPVRTRHDGFVAKLSACGRGRHPAVVSVGEDGHFRVWSLRKGDVGRLLHDVGSFLGSDYSVAIVSDGIVYAGGDDGVVRVFSIAKGRYIGSLTDHGQTAVTALSVCRSGSGAKEQVYVASGDAKGEVVLTVLSSRGDVWVSQHKYVGCPDEVTALCILPRARKLVVGNFEGFASVWDWDSSGSRTPLIGHRDQVLQICALGGANLVATSCSNGFVYVWSTSPGKLLWRREVGFSLSAASLRRFCCYHYFDSVYPDKEPPRVVQRHPFVLLRESFGRELFALNMIESAMSESDFKGACIFDVQITAVEEVAVSGGQSSEADALLVIIGLENGQLRVTELLTAVAHTRPALTAPLRSSRTSSCF